MVVEEELSGPEEDNTGLYLLKECIKRRSDSLYLVEYSKGFGMVE